MSNQYHKKLKGLTVEVKDGNAEKALRKFKKKVLESGILNEIRDRQTYEKPTTVRKKKKAAARARWRKELAKTAMPKKLY